MIMKNILYCCLLMTLAACCGQKHEWETVKAADIQDNPQDTLFMADTIGIRTDKDVIIDIYKAVFDGNSEVLMKNCTPSVVKRLKIDYDYDGDGMAIWELRSGEQDGPDEISRLTAIKPLGDGWYQIYFLDMGNKGSRKVRITGGKLADFK